MKDWFLLHTHPEDIFARFCDKELDFHPGQQFKYSNSGYTLLGLVLEKILGNSYSSIIHDAILKPLKMNDTEVDSTLKIVKDRASGIIYDITIFLFRIDVHRSVHHTNKDQLYHKMVLSRTTFFELNCLLSDQQN